MFYSIIYTLYSLFYSISSPCILHYIEYTRRMVMVHSMPCTLYSVPCALYSVLGTLYSVLCTLYFVLCTLCTILCTLYSVPYALYSVLCTLYSVLYLLCGDQPIIISNHSTNSQTFEDKCCCLFDNEFCGDIAVINTNTPLSTAPQLPVFTKR